jgi:hypothetical protein
MVENSWMLPTRKGSVLTNFQIPPYELIEPQGKLGIMLSVPTL